MAIVEESKTLKKQRQVRPGSSEFARQLAEDNREALDYLAAYDRGDKTALRVRFEQPK